MEAFWTRSSTNPQQWQICVSPLAGEILTLPLQFQILLRQPLAGFGAGIHLQVQALVPDKLHNLNSLLASGFLYGAYVQLVLVDQHRLAVPVFLIFADILFLRPNSGKPYIPRGSNRGIQAI